MTTQLHSITGAYQTDKGYASVSVIITADGMEGAVADVADKLIAKIGEAAFEIGMTHVKTDGVADLGETRAAFERALKK